MKLNVFYTAPLPPGFTSGTVELKSQTLYIDKDGLVNQPYYRANISADRGLSDVQALAQLQIVGMGQGDPATASPLDVVVTLVVTGLPTPLRSTFRVIPLDTGGGKLNLHLPAIGVPLVGPPDQTLLQLIANAQAGVDALNNAQTTLSVALGLVPQAVNATYQARDAALGAAALANITPVADAAAKDAFFANPNTPAIAACRRQDDLHIWNRYNGVISDLGPWSLATLNYLTEVGRLLSTAPLLRPAEITSIPRQPRRAVMAVIDDDAYIQGFTILKPILDAFGAKASFALTVNFLNSGSGFMNTAQALQLQAEGHSMLGHSMSHKDETTYGADVAGLYNDLLSTRTILQGFGFKINHHVYPFTNNNQQVREAVRATGYRSAIGIGAEPQVPPLRQYAVKRFPVTSQTTQAQLNAWADQVLAANGMGVMLIHSGFDFPPAVQGYFRNFIQYAQGLGIEFMSYDKAFEIFGNQVDIGDYTGGYGMVADRDGVFWSDQAGAMWRKPQDTYTAAMGRLAFPDERVVRCGISSSNAAGFPDTAGVLETDRTIGATYGYNRFNRQTFWGYRTNTIWQRVALTDTTWTDWERISNDNPPVINAGFNAFNGNSLPTAFRQGAITIVPFNSSGAQGYPSDFYAGQMTVDLTGGQGWGFRTLKKYQAPDTYVSSQQGDGTWGGWIKTGPNNVQPSLDVTQSGSAGSVPAGGRARITFNVPGVNQGDGVIATRANELFDGLIVAQVGCYQNGVVTVTVRNLSGSTFSDDTQQWRIQVVRS